MDSGIYKIENTVNGKVYVGQAINIRERWRKHRYNLKNNRKKPNPHLQNAWNKYSENSFKFSILEECGPIKEILTVCEQKWVDELKAYNREFGYNKRAIVDSNLGIKLSEETRKKLSLANSGKNNPNYGKHLSEETCKKISEGNKGNKPNSSSFKKGHKTNVGRVVSEETRKKLSLANIGKIQSEEIKKKLSELKKGKSLSEEHRRKISEGTKGKIVSEETCKKLSLINRGENNPNYGLTKEVCIINGIEHYKCCRCNDFLLREKFHFCVTCAYGIYPSCKKCRSVYRKKRYIESKLMKQGKNKKKESREE